MNGFQIGETLEDQYRLLNLPFEKGGAKKRINDLACEDPWSTLPLPPPDWNVNV